MLFRSEMNCPRRHMLTKQEILLGKGTRMESSRVRETRELLFCVARSLRFYGDGISFQVVFGQSLYFRVFPGGARIAQPRWMLARGILERRRTRGVSFRPFPNSSVGGGLLVPYSLSGSPVIKQLMQMVTMVPGQGGRFQSVRFP